MDIKKGFAAFGFALAVAGACAVGGTLFGIAVSPLLAAGMMLGGTLMVGGAVLTDAMQHERTSRQIALKPA